MARIGSSTSNPTRWPICCWTGLPAIRVRRVPAGRIEGRAADPHDPVGLIVGLNCPAVKLVDLHALLDHVEAVLEVVEYLLLCRQVRTVPAETPLDVPGSEHGMRLVQTHVRVCVDPHPADAFSPVDQDDFLIARQVLTGNKESVEPGDAGSHDADLAALYRDVTRSISGWLKGRHQWSLSLQHAPVVPGGDDDSIVCRCRGAS
jgi:hypothetical protein